jgi:hypothetical protein
VAKAYWINTFRVVRNPKKVTDYIEIAGPVMREWEVASWPRPAGEGIRGRCLRAHRDHRV